MKQVVTILKAALNLLILQTQDLFKNNIETDSVQSLPARWALIPVENGNRLINK